MPEPLLPQGTLDFTGLVRDDMLSRLQTLFNQVNPEWDDFSAAFPENLLLEGMVFISDIIRGTMEERVRQLNWATITDRLAAIRLGRLAGFTLPGATAATLTGAFSIASGIPATKEIPTPLATRVRTGPSNQPKKYRVLSVDAKIAVGETSVQVNLEQAELATELFESTEEPNIELQLDRTPYIDGSAEITAGDGTYTEFSSFLGVASTIKAFVVLVDDSGLARVRFGTGINGAIPQGNIQAIYKVGGGVAGEVEANAAWVIEDALSDIDGDPVSLIFTNATASSVGIDALTVEEARVRGPLSLRTINRMVIEEDFEFVATSVPGIARALMATSEIAGEIVEDTGRLEVIAVGTKLKSGRFAPAAPTTAKLDEIRSLMVEDGPFPPVMGFSFIVVAAELLTINVGVRVFKEANAAPDDVAVAIQDALDDFFAVTLVDGTPNPAINFGARLLGSDGQPDFLIPWSSIFNAVLDAEGVRYISSAANNLLINNAHGSVSVGARQFPKLGLVTIFDQDQGGLQI